jgi:uncharacterized protein involved in exopolysaccharide biosynthesis
MEFNGDKTGMVATLLGRLHDLLDGVDFKTLSDAIVIKRRERTFVVEIHAFSSNPDKAANLANGLANAYIAEEVESRVASTEKDAKWVRQRLDALKTQIVDAEAKVEAFKSRNHIVTSEGLRSNESQIANAANELGLARARLSEAKSRLGQVLRDARAGHADIASEALKSPTIERLRAQQADADREVARLSQTLAGRHPALLQAQAEAATQRARVNDELQRIQASARSEFLGAEANERQLTSSVERLKTQSNDASRANLALRQLERDVETLRGSYDNFAKVNDGLTQQQSDTPPARIIAAAYPPRSPASPRVWLVALASLWHGLFAGAAAALLRDRFASAKRPSQWAQQPKPAAARREHAPAE